MNIRRERLRVLINSILLMTVGALIGAVQVAIFMIPAEVVPGGVSSLAIIFNTLTGFPVGIAILILNIPIQIIGYRMLGGWGVIAGTIYVLLIYSFAVDAIQLADIEPVSEDRLLLTLFGGAVGGLSSGLIYRAGGTFGGTSTLARIIQQRTGTPLSTTLLYTDTLMIALAGLVFGWESALYSMIALVVSGLAADYVMEGPSVIRTATIVTDHPDAIADVVIHVMDRSGTIWNGTGIYTEQPHSVLFVTVSRAEVNRLRQLVFEVDPGAFVVIGQGHTAYGEGFREIKTRPEKPAE